MKDTINEVLKEIELIGNSKDQCGLLSSLSNLKNLISTSTPSNHQNLQEIEGENVDTETKYKIASALFRLIKIHQFSNLNAPQSITSDLDRSGSTTLPVENSLIQCFRLCGYGVTFIAATEFLQSYSKKDREHEIERHNKNHVLYIRRGVFMCLRVVQTLLFNKSYDNNMNVVLWKKVIEDYALFSVFVKQKDKQNYETCEDKERLLKMHKKEETIDELSKLLMTFPIQASAALYSYDRSCALPNWITRRKYPQMIVERLANSALFFKVSEHERNNKLDSVNDAFNCTHMLLHSIVRRMVRFGGVDDVSLGLYAVWNRNVWYSVQKQNKRHHLSAYKKLTKSIILSFIATTPKLLSNVTNPRDASKIIQSLMKHAATSAVSKESVIKAILFIKNTTLLSIQSSTLLRDEIFQSIVLSYSSVGISTNEEEQLEEHNPKFRNSKIKETAFGDNHTATTFAFHFLPRCLASIFLLCLDEEKHLDDIDSEHFSYNNAYDGGIDDSIGPFPINIMQTKIILSYVNEAAEIWCTPTFVNRTEVSHQRHVTRFILYALDHLSKIKNVVGTSGNQNDRQHPNIEAYALSLVNGVTERLNCVNISVRLDGMRVGEKLAPLIGHALHFDELDGEKGAEILENEVWELSFFGSEIVALEQSSTISQIDKTKSKNKRTGIKKVAGKNDIHIMDSLTQSSEQNNALFEDGCISDQGFISDDSTCNDDQFEQSNLSDDEEDLRVIKRPYYLRECLSLLRCTENDTDAFSQHEAALHALPSLVRSKPPDLADLAVPLAKNLLHFENKFDMEKFDEYKREAIISLVVLEPVSVSDCFIRDHLFSSISTGTRLEILDVLCCASQELCGQADLLERRKLRLNKQNDGNMKRSKVSGKRHLVRDGHDPSHDDYHGKLGSRDDENKTRRWGRGRNDGGLEYAVRNNFGATAAMFFYPIISGFMSAKNEPFMQKEDGLRILAKVLVSLSCFVDCAGNCPGTSILASDLFAFSWSFRCSESSDVRLSVFVSIATCISFLPSDEVLNLCYKTDGLSHFLQDTAERDPDYQCRSLALLVSHNVVKLCLP